MTILEVYTDQQTELINGGGHCHRRRQCHDVDTILQARCQAFSGKVKMKIMQINSIIGNLSMHH